MSDEIVFPDVHEQWSMDRTSLLILATHGNSRIMCVLTYFVLMDYYPFELRPQEKETSVRDVYAKYHEQIQDVFRRMIADGLFNAAGEVVPIAL